MQRPAAIALLLILPLGLFTGGSFVSDDWFVLQRDAHITPADWPTVFSSLFSGWYRPLFDLVIHVLWRLFGLTAWPYQWLCLVGLAGCAILVGRLCTQLLGTSTAAWQGTFVFSSLAVHAETTFWLAAFNEVLAGFFILAAACIFLDYLTKLSRLRIALIAVASLAAIMSKETGLAVLPVLAACSLPHLVKHRSRGLGAVFAGLAAPLAILSVYVPWRLAAGLPGYAGATHDAGGLLKNLVYYFLMLFVGFPASMHTFGHDSSPWLRLVTIAAVTTCFLVLAVLALLAIRAAKISLADLEATHRALTALLVGVLWSIAGLAATLPIVAERTAFIASAGAAVAVVALWRLAAGPGTAQLTPRLPHAHALLAVFCLAQFVSLGARGLSWHIARHVSATTMARLETSMHGVAPGALVCVVGLPDQYENAYLFQNAFPAAAEVLGWPQRVIGVTKAAFENGSTPECASAARMIGADELSR